MKRSLFHIVRILIVPFALLIAFWEHIGLREIEKTPRKDSPSPVLLEL